MTIYTALASINEIGGIGAEFVDLQVPPTEYEQFHERNMEKIERADPRFCGIHMTKTKRQTLPDRSVCLREAEHRELCTVNWTVNRIGRRTKLDEQPKTFWRPVLKLFCSRKPPNASVRLLAQ